MSNNYEDQTLENELKQHEQGVIDPAQFKEMSIDELTSILDLTIKKDNVNKALIFLSMLSAYTNENQINVSLNAPSSSGKTYIPLEIAKLFPQEDVIKLAACSPTAFIHEYGELDQETHVMKVSLERKIIIFLDQANNQVLARLRPLLSHDQKEIISKITEKSGGGNRTKTVIMIGYPSVIFCTAGLNLDEQEATRFLLLSPEIDKEKLKQAVTSRIERETDKSIFTGKIKASVERQQLIQRILAVRSLGITDIKIANPEMLHERFINDKIKPRTQRDTARFASFVKAIALLNPWYRQLEGTVITASEEDVKTTIKLWEEIADSQEIGLPPFVYSVYKDIIVPTFNELNKHDVGDKKVGVSRHALQKVYYDVHGSNLPDWQLRQTIDMLETTGLITQEKDPDDKRQMRIFPNNRKGSTSENNSAERPVMQLATEIEETFF